MKRLRLVLLAAVLLGVVGVWLCLCWWEQSIDPPYCLVEDGLYLGSSVERPPPGTQAVVNLCGRADPYRVEACLWEPTFEGGKEPDLGWLRRVVDFIGAQREAGKTTYVHCQAGMNRSASAVAAYLMQEHGWGREQALAFVRKRRPQAQPDAILLRLLGEWERALKEGGDRER